MSCQCNLASPRFTHVQLDMNLLTALDALLEEGSVAGAAQRMHLSAPAMSRTLGRIRRATGDQILVRTGRTMTPTPRATEMRAEVHDLVQRARDVLQAERDLDLASLERVFTIRGHDAVTTAIGPRLMSVVQTHAPGVSVRLLAEASADTNDLRHGRVDLEVGSNEPELPEVRADLLGHDRLVAAMRADHPLIRGTLTPKRFAGAEHLIVSRRGRLHDPIDEALAAQGLSRRVLASAPTSTAGLYYVRHTDLVVAVPEHVCRATIEALGLRTRPLPVEMPPVPLYLAWHERYTNDKAHSWFRSQMHSSFDELFGREAA